MSNLGDQVFNLTMGNLITLWILDFSDVIGVPNSRVYITPYRDGNSNINYNGQVYHYVGVSASGFRSEINGQLPEPNINFDKAALNRVPGFATIRDNYIATYQEVFFDWAGARITRIRTTSNNLGNPSLSETSSFIVDQTTRTSPSTIEVKLSVSVAADRLNSQAVQELMPNRCSLRYRLWDDTINNFRYLSVADGGCPYGNPTSPTDWTDVPDFGNLHFNADNAPLDSANRKFDICQYTLKACQLRFDPQLQGMPLPFRGKYRPFTSIDQDVI
jgi:phage-related protein